MHATVRLQSRDTLFRSKLCFNCNQAVTGRRLRSGTLTAPSRHLQPQPSTDPHNLYPFARGASALFGARSSPRPARKPSSALSLRFQRSVVKMATTAQSSSAAAGSGGPLRGGATDDLQLRNRLDESKSPYVREHKDNPVAWQMWTEETLALAKSSQRLIFLSVGYAACHCEYAQ
jgi:hypothetical protein